MQEPETRFAWNGDVPLAHQVVGEGSADFTDTVGSTKRAAELGDRAGRTSSPVATPP